MKILENAARVTVLLGAAVISGMLASSRMTAQKPVKRTSETYDQQVSKYQTRPMIHILQWQPNGEWLLFAKEISIYSASTSQHLQNASGRDRHAAFVSQCAHY